MLAVEHCILTIASCCWHNADIAFYVAESQKPTQSQYHSPMCYTIGTNGLTDILYQVDRDYMIADVPSRWDIGGASVCGAGGRYRSDECGRMVL